MAMLKSPGMLIKNALVIDGADKKTVVDEDAGDKQLSPEFEAIIEEYKKNEATLNK